MRSDGRPAYLDCSPPGPEARGYNESRDRYSQPLKIKPTELNAENAKDAETMDYSLIKSRSDIL